MTTQIFREIPKADDFKIPFRLKEKFLLEWLLELSKKNSKEACSLTLQWLQALNKTDLAAKPRFSFLKTSHEYLRDYFNHLESSCWDASLPLSAKEQDYAEAVAWNYLALSEGFFIAAETLESRAEEMLALYMSCYSLGQAQLHIAAVYKTPNASFWQLTYKIFTWAEKYNLLGTKINDGNLKHITLNDMFAQIFIFHICDATQFRPRDMLTIFNFLPKVCSNFKLYKLFDIKFQIDVLKISPLRALVNNFSNLLEVKIVDKMTASQDLFVFDTQQNIAPNVFNQTYSFSSPSLRYFTSATVVKNLEQITNKGELWSGILKSINHELFSRVIKTLEPGIKRKYDRIQAEYNILGIIGFENTLAFLYKISHKNQLAKEKDAVDSPTSYEELTTYAHKVKPQMGAIDGGFFEIDFESQSAQNNTIWGNSNEIDITNKPVLIKKLSIFDSSTHGYSLYWADNQNAKAKVGDIFAIISDDKKRLEIAIIRRIAMSNEKDYKFGTELLGLESEIVMITPMDDQNSAKWGIFIRGSQTLNQADSVVYPIGHFKIGDCIDIYKSNKKIKAVLKKELNVTVAVIHVELETLIF